jgi:hypothetical protein
MILRMLYALYDFLDRSFSQISPEKFAERYRIRFLEPEKVNGAFYKPVGPRILGIELLRPNRFVGEPVFCYSDKPDLGYVEMVIRDEENIRCVGTLVARL